MVKDVRNDNLWRPEAAVYVPFAQSPMPSVFLAVRTAVPPMSVMPDVRNALRSLDNEQPVNDIETMSDVVAETYGAIRFPMTLLWIFSALALVLLPQWGVFGVQRDVLHGQAGARRKWLSTRGAGGQAEERDCYGCYYSRGLG